MSLGTLVLLAGIFLVAILYCLFKAIMTNAEAIQKMFGVIKQLSDIVKTTSNHDQEIKQLFDTTAELREKLKKMNGVKACDQRST